jgi:hypothetical protein
MGLASSICIQIMHSVQKKKTLVCMNDFGKKNVTIKMQYLCLNLALEFNFYPYWRMYIKILFENLNADFVSFRKYRLHQNVSV